MPPSQGGSIWTEVVLHTFAGADGAHPTGGLIPDTSGALYGTTQYGGLLICGPNGCGTVFKLTPPTQGQTAWTENVLFAFGAQGGQFPNPGLIADTSGALYGTTADGGAAGTVFMLSPPPQGQTSWTQAVLHLFAGAPADGARPDAGLTPGPNGHLYGTTMRGGRHNRGTVFVVRLK
jgi:uncharacterized repeat protein (TIGR03803 family)